MVSSPDSKENLYPSYRIDLFEGKILPAIKLGECLLIEGQSGVGKSKYLRHLTSSNSIQKKHLKPNKISLYYLDLNWVYDYTIESLLTNLGKILETKSYTADVIDNKIVNILNGNSKIYLIFDHFEQLNYFPEPVIRFLRSLRDKHKYQLGFIFGYEADKNLDKEKLKYLLNMTNIKIQIPPLTYEESIINVKHFIDLKKIDLGSNDIELIAKVSKGLPRDINNIITKIHLGFSVNEAIETYAELTPETNQTNIDKTNPINENITSEVKQDSNISNSSNSNNNDIDIQYVQKQALRNMTKSEYLVFNELISNKGSIVTRDKLASLLNPDLDGEGVSNESIDQLISRVRKAISKLNFHLKIKTKHGVGYYID